MSPKVERYNWWEDSDHCFITKTINSADVEMSNKTGSDWISSTTWRAHGSNQLYVNQCDFTCVLKIIPWKHIKIQNDQL